jgi:hypothetical protein
MTMTHIYRRKLTTVFADVMELVYVLVLEAKFCEFESHHPHQINAPLDKLVKSLLSKGRVLSVRIRDGVPVKRQQPVLVVLAFDRNLVPN